MRFIIQSTPEEATWTFNLHKSNALSSPPAGEVKRKSEEKSQKRKIRREKSDG